MLDCVGVGLRWGWDWAGMADGGGVEMGSWGALGWG